jgi:hypothetical protein
MNIYDFFIFYVISSSFQKTKMKTEQKQVRKLILFFLGKHDYRMTAVYIIWNSEFDEIIFCIFNYFNPFGWKERKLEGKHGN